jgi:hypothetical protein
MTRFPGFFFRPFCRLVCLVDTLDADNNTNLVIALS